jgi:hypothetical protein
MRGRPLPKQRESKLTRNQKMDAGVRGNDGVVRVIIQSNQAQNPSIDAQFRPY